MPFGTLAPSARKRFGSRRYSTTSLSSSLASSAPAISLQLIDGEASGLISTGLVFGMWRISTSTETASSPMKTIGSQWSMNVWKSGSQRKFAPIIIAILMSAPCAAYSTLARRAFGRRPRPALAQGAPSTTTMSAVKSLAPRMSDEPTP